jgi:hypothetical protein
MLVTMFFFILGGGGSEFFPSSTVITVVRVPLGNFQMFLEGKLSHVVTFDFIISLSKRVLMNYLRILLFVLFQFFHICPV